MFVILKIKERKQKTKAKAKETIKQIKREIVLNYCS